MRPPRVQGWGAAQVKGRCQEMEKTERSQLHCAAEVQAPIRLFQWSEVGPHTTESYGQGTCQGSSWGTMGDQKLGMDRRTPGQPSLLNVHEVVRINHLDLSLHKQAVWTPPLYQAQPLPSLKAHNPLPPLIFHGLVQEY